MSGYTLSGPAAFWCLPAMAFSVILQPSGRPCTSFHFTSRIALRTLPIICAADFISLVVHILNLWLAGLPWRIAASLLFKSRYECCAYCKSSEDDETLIMLQGQVYLRYLPFLFGAIPGAIKVYATENTPWTKAWMSMYLADFVLIELLVLLAKEHPAYGRRPGQRLERAYLDLANRREKAMAWVHLLLGQAALLIQAIMSQGHLAVTFIDTALGFRDFSISASPALFAVWLSGGWFGWSFVDGTVWRDYDKLKATFFVFLTPVLFYIVMIAQFANFRLAYREREVVGPYPFPANPLTPWSNWPALLPLVVTMAASVATRLTGLRKVVFFLPSPPEETPKPVEREAWQSFALMVHTVAAAFVGYAFYYRAEETVKPDWLEWFG